MTNEAAGIEIGSRRIGPGNPTYIIAEMSANHRQEFDTAVHTLRAIAESGADAVKLQTYTPDTLTINCDQDWFRIESGTIWDGRTLYDLYADAYMPWDWQPRLAELARELGLDLFSTPFDGTAIDFLEEMSVPAYKVASFEIVDLPLITRIASTGKPMIISTGMASLTEIAEAVETVHATNNRAMALLKCTSAYPSLPEEMNLRTIENLRDTFGVPVGLSDHTLGTAVPVAAVALGACIVEKHFTLSRDIQGPDTEFSLEPHEFQEMVQSIRVCEQALGRVTYRQTPREQASASFRRSLFVVKDTEAGEAFTVDNVRSIRPGNGLPCKLLDMVTQKRAAVRIARGTPLLWSHLS